MFAQSQYRFIRDPNTAVYFGHISYTEAQHDGKDPVVLREGNTTPEVAVLNFPIAPGDTVITPADRRCEIQFDTGTIVRLDTDTEVKVETILALSLTTPSKLTNFILKRGQIYVMYKQYSPSEVLQILFSNASAKFKHNSVLMLRANTDGSTDVRVDTGKASLLFGPDERHIKKIDLKKLEEVTISVHNKILYTKYDGSVDFSLWNQEMNKNFLALHKGISNLPKPIQRMSPAVFNFAQKFSNLFGEWLWDDIYGYVWRPFINDHRYPSGDWKPYYYGQWRKINQDLFWVPQESWGWVPYHLGVWTWSKNKGWLWIPGGAFAPSWVSWNFYMGHFSWRPLTLWDYVFTHGLYTAYMPWHYYTYSGDDPSNDNIGSSGGSSKKKVILTKINKNQLQKKSTAPGLPSKNIRKILTRLVDAFHRGDMDVIESMKETPKTMIAVRGDQLSSSSIQRWMLEMDQMSAIIQNGLMVRDPSVNPLGYANMAFRRNDYIANLALNILVTEPDSLGGMAIQSRSIQPFVWSSEGINDPVNSQLSYEKNESGGFELQPGRLSDLKHSSSRFRDWNPDVKVAIRSGLTITYSSLENAVRVPELDRTSGTGRVGAFNLSRGRSSTISSFSSGSASSSSSSSGSSGSSSTGSSSSKGSSSSSRAGSVSKTIK